MKYAKTVNEFGETTFVYCASSKKIIEHIYENYIDLTNDNVGLDFISANKAKNEMIRIARTEGYESIVKPYWSAKDIALELQGLVYSRIGVYY